MASELLYPFVHVPAVVDITFFGLLQLMQPHNIALSIVVAGLQYGVAHLSMARTSAGAANLPKERQAAHRMQRSMMLYFLPVLMGVVSYSLPAAVGLYFAAGNLVSLGQELVIKRQLSRKN